MSETLEWFGYFDLPGSPSPAFDPGLGVACPHCGTPLLSGDDRKTISVMAENSERSYFYRAHKPCHDGASFEAIQAIESLVIDPDAMQ